jgi:hypothetical protein
MKNWGRRLVLIAGVVAGLTALVQPSWADRDDWRWHGRIERFHEHDWDMWRGGYWRHESHEGRWGWWWIVGPTWYFYPEPVYPYPNPYEPPVAVIVQPAPAKAPPPPPPQNWYYCESAKGYYPYVPACPGGWRAVPATPGTPPASPPAAPPAPAPSPPQ